MFLEIFGRQTPPSIGPLFQNLREVWRDLQASFDLDDQRGRQSFRRLQEVAVSGFLSS